MIRRWSRVNTTYVFSFHNPFFNIRFNIRKLIRALNFKKYIIGFSKFKRLKLAIFKRRRNWLPLTNIIRLWIWDYEFNKKIVRSQFLDFIFYNSFFVFDFRYNQKANPLTFVYFREFILNGLSKIFFLRLLKTSKSPRNLMSFNFIHNSNYMIAYFSNNTDKKINKEFFLNYLNISNTTIPSFLKSETYFYDVNISDKLIENSTHLFLNFTDRFVLKQFVEIYQIFIFLYLNNIIKR